MNFRTSFLSSGTYADLGGKWEEKHVSKRGEFAHVFQRKSACDSYRPSRILSLEFICIGHRKKRLISIPTKNKIY